MNKPIMMAGANMDAPSRIADTQDLLEDELLNWEDDHTDGPEMKRRAIVVEHKTSRSTKPNNVQLEAGTAELANSDTLPNLPYIIPQKAVLFPGSNVKQPPTPNLSPTTGNISEHIRHACLVDTRGLDTVEGNQVLDTFRTNALLSLSRLAKRGAAPLILGCTACIENSKGSFRRRNKKSRGTLGATARRIDQGNLSELETMVDSNNNKAFKIALEKLLPTLAISPPINAGNLKCKDSVKLPIRLLPHATWQIWIDMVQAAVEAEKKMNHIGLVPVAMDVTILSSDVACLCDTNTEAHQHGVNRFWNRVRDFFQNGSIRSIEIVILQTNSIILRCKDYKGVVENNSMEILVDHMILSDGLPSHKQSLDDCITTIRKQLMERSRDDFSYRAFDDPSNPVAIKLTLKQNDSLGFNSLERSFVRRMLSHRRGLFTFELPETCDGTQCAVCLEAKYKILPFRADSAAANGLLVDLQRITAAIFQIVQLVPLSCVDGAMMFGTPLAVAAAFDDDHVKYEEMKSLFSLLLDYLCKNDCAILLRSTDTDDCSDHSLGVPLYHSNGQTFLLMAEEMPGRELLSQSANTSQSSVDIGKKVSPSEAMLFRYVTSEQVIDLDRYYVAGKVEGDPKTLRQLADYVDSSMDCLESNALNPLLTMPRAEDPVISCDESVVMVHSAESQEASIKENWNDDAGVGCQVPVFDTCFSNDEIKKDQDISSDRNKGWNKRNGAGAHHESSDDQESKKPDKSTSLDEDWSYINGNVIDKDQITENENEIDDEVWNDKNGVGAHPRTENDDDPNDRIEPEDSNLLFEYEYE